MRLQPQRQGREPCCQSRFLDQALTILAYIWLPEIRIFKFFEPYWTCFMKVESAVVLFFDHFILYWACIADC